MLGPCTHTDIFGCVVFADQFLPFVVYTIDPKIFTDSLISLSKNFYREKPHSRGQIKHKHINMLCKMQITSCCIWSTYSYVHL